MVYDYSPQEGVHRGKPWTIVEPGKCYLIDEQATSYAIRSKTSGEPSAALNTLQRDYNPQTSLRDALCAPSERGVYPAPCANQDLDIQEVPLPLIGGPAVGLEDAVHELGVTAGGVFPTKYVPGMGVAYFTGMAPEAMPYMKDPLFTTLKATYESLAGELNAAVASCDARVRTEYRVRPTFYQESWGSGIQFSGDMKVIWRMKSGADVTAPAPHKDQAGILDRLGCGDAYRAFVTTHADAFKRLDALTEQLNKKYPHPPVSFYTTRDAATLAQLRSYLAHAAPAIPEVVPQQEDRVMEQPTQPEDAGITSKSQQQLEVLRTELDGSADRVELTPSEKAHAVATERDPLFMIYILLPLVALVGMVIGFLLKR
jgi:hypothetical protein